MDETNSNAGRRADAPIVHGDAWYQHPNGRMLYGDRTGGTTLAGVVCYWKHGPDRDAALAEAEQLMAVGAAVRRAFAPDLVTQVRLADLEPAICPGCELVIPVDDDRDTVRYQRRSWHASCWADARQAAAGLPPCAAIHEHGPGCFHG